MSDWGTTYNDMIQRLFYRMWGSGLVDVIIVQLSYYYLIMRSRSENSVGWSSSMTHSCVLAIVACSYALIIIAYSCALVSCVLAVIAYRGTFAYI